jgi:hypothetical protein
VAADDLEEHPDEGRVKQLLDQLAEVLRSMPADRQKAFRKYLDEQIEQEETDDGRDPEEGDPGQR